MRRPHVFGSIGLLIAFIAPLAGIMAGVMEFLKTRGDVGGITGLFTAILVAGALWALGALFGILGLLYDDNRSMSVAALIVSLGGEGIIFVMFITGR